MRKRIATTASALAVATAVGLGAGSADAKTVQADPSGCNRNVCMSLTTSSPGHVFVHGWAYRDKFYGHFELKGPNGLHKNSSTGWYYGGSAGPTWDVPAVVGKYCIIGWSNRGSGGYDNIGEPCLDIR